MSCASSKHFSRIPKKQYRSSKHPLRLCILLRHFPPLPKHRPLCLWARYINHREISASLFPGCLQNKNSRAAMEREDGGKKTQSTFCSLSSLSSSPSLCTHLVLAPSPRLRSPHYLRGSRIACCNSHFPPPRLLQRLGYFVVHLFLVGECPSSFFAAFFFRLAQVFCTPLVSHCILLSPFPSTL